MSNPRMRKDCNECGTPDVEFTAGVGGELYGECPNCEASQTEYDRSYKVVDSDDISVTADEARRENRQKGFFW